MFTEDGKLEVVGELSSEERLTFKSVFCMKSLPGMRIIQEESTIAYLQELERNSKLDVELQENCFKLFPHPCV